MTAFAEAYTERRPERGCGILALTACIAQEEMLPCLVASPLHYPEQASPVPVVVAEVDR